MRVCIPVGEYRGLESSLHGHFGSAPNFVLVDTETNAIECLPNQDRAHDRGACRPLKALAGAEADAVIVAGIGPGALTGLQLAGLTVYRAPTGKVADALRSFNNGELEELSTEGACAHRGRHSGCDNHH